MDKKRINEAIESARWIRFNTEEMKKAAYDLAQIYAEQGKTRMHVIWKEKYAQYVDDVKAVEREIEVLQQMAKQEP